MVRILLCLFSTYQCSGSRTMMSVGNIKSWHFSKFGGDSRNVFALVNNPKSMSETVTRSDKVIDGLFQSIFLDDNIQFIIIGISKEYGFDIRIVHTNVLHTVFFLITTGKLMLLDDTVHIVRNISAYYQSILSFPVHGLGIDVIVFLCILH